MSAVMGGWCAAVTLPRTGPGVTRASVLGMIAKDAAPGIDRLVYAVGRNARRVDQDGLAAVLETVGLDSPGLFNGLGDLILAGALTDEVAELRYRYMADGDRTKFLEDAVSEGHLDFADGFYGASEPVLALLSFTETRRGAAAAELWGSFASEVEELTAFCGEVIGASGESPLLQVYEAVPLPEGAELRLFALLERMRYLRSDAHAFAWSAAGLTAGDMVELTPIWNGKEPRGMEATLASLEERGLLNHGTLTKQGQAVRDRIEAETNRFAQQALDALGDRGDRFVELLVTLPDEPA